MRAAWLWVVALALVACGTGTGGTPTAVDSSAPSLPVVGPVDLAVPIGMHPVVEAGTTVLPDPSGEQLTLADPVMTIERLDRAEVRADQTGAGWVLSLTLTDEDARTFADWTSEHIGERLAMVVDGEVVIAPTIQDAITGGAVQITGDYTRDEIEDLLGTITGR